MNLTLYTFVIPSKIKYDFNFFFKMNCYSKKKPVGNHQGNHDSKLRYKQIVFEVQINIHLKLM